ncbi:MAG: hypothetical protein R2705_15260 [Ilumatobacteraceae bacterium]
MKIGSASRATQFAKGKFTFPGAGVHPLVKVAADTRRMAWNPDVVGAFRRAAELRCRGWSWDDIATEVGAAIPAPTLRRLPDRHAEQASREKANVSRTRRGLAPLPLRYLDVAGTVPNPAYVPESYLNLTDPGAQLERMLFPGARGGLNGSPRTTDGRRLTEAEAFRDFVVGGVYRRATKDQANPGDMVWLEYDLGPCDELGGVLSFEDFEALVGTRRVVAGRTSYMPLSSLFEPTAEALVLKGRLLNPEDGRLVFRTHHPHYNVRWEPHRVGQPVNIVASMTAQDLHGSITDAIIRALDGEPIGWSCSLHQPLRARSLADRRAAELRDELDDRVRRRDLALRNLGDPDLEAQRSHFVEQLNSTLAEIDSLEGEIELVEAARREESVSGDVEITELVDVLAVLRSSSMVTRPVAVWLRPLMRTLLVGTSMSLHPETSSFRWSAVLALDTSVGVLRIPLSGEVDGRFRAGVDLGARKAM